VDPLAPPPSVPIGERVVFSDCEISSPAGGNRGSKAFGKVASLLRVDAWGVATYDGVPFMTSGGACTSNIPGGSIS
jgi:aminoacyl tRNA synthase complex-interacting multifunctional protein 1